MSRRTMIAGMATLSLASLAGLARAAADESSAAPKEPPAPAPVPGGKPFPKGFRWGVSTAGHQVEGNNTNSDFWFLENTKPTTFAERSGDACDSYHRYEEDIALLARLGFNSYRFSLEWARIEPSPGCFSIAELDYYKRVMECCHKHGVEPAATFLHNTAPHWFASAGAWLNPESPKWFARYCSTAAKALARNMGIAFTINEPQVAKVFRALPGAGGSFAKRDEAARAMHAAAAKAAASERYVTMEYPDIEAMTPQLLAAHAQGFAAIKAERQELPLSVTLNILDFQPGTENSPYGETRQRTYGEWLEAVRQAGDFVAVQVYRQFRIPGSGQPLPPPPRLPFFDPKNFFAQTARPEALRNGVEYAYAQTKKPVLVSENGIDTENDEKRIWHVDASLAGLQESIAKGVPVLGYYHWSLLDNFEWTSGYKPKYGLVEVDRTTFGRKPKPSATHLGAIARRNAIL